VVADLVVLKAQKDCLSVDLKDAYSVELMVNGKVERSAGLKEFYMAVDLVALLGIEKVGTMDAYWASYSVAKRELNWVAQTVFGLVGWTVSK
jgi:hypothetical protein